MLVDWTIEQGRYGLRMVLTGPWSAAAEHEMIARKVKEVELNYAKGWVRSDMSFLKRIEDLRSIDILDFNLQDVSVVNEVHSLRHLGISTYCKTELDFSSWPQLEDCAIEWRPAATSLFGHRGLKKVFINKFTGENLTAFSKIRTLESLSLATPGRLESLRGVGNLKKLNFLGIYRALWLRSLEGVESLKRLTHLEIYACRKLGNISPIAKLHCLKILHICNCGQIESLSPLAALRNLESFLFYESTNVLDGDLGVLVRLPKLREVAFQQRRHYSHKREDLAQS